MSKLFAPRGTTYLNTIKGGRKRRPKHVAREDASLSLSCFDPRGVVGGDEALVSTQTLVVAQVRGRWPSPASYALAVADTFPEIAHSALSFLTRDYGFRLAAEDQHHIRLESEALAVEAWHDPRGEVEVRVSRLNSADRYAVWTYTGMVGTASVSRLLEIAVETMTADPAILSGDQAYYEQLAAENRLLSEAWTAYYAGKGPQPREKLPQ